MSTQKPRGVKSRVMSIRYALRGLKRLVTQEPNILIHLAATIGVITISYLKGLTKWEWLAIIFAVGIVWVAEAFNTCIELLCDLYSKEYNRTIEIIKDISAAAVLIAAFTSVVIGILVLFT